MSGGHRSGDCCIHSVLAGLLAADAVPAEWKKVIVDDMDADSAQG
jgi:hypothetical protein